MRKLILGLLLAGSAVAPSTAAPAATPAAAAAGADATPDAAAKAAGLRLARLVYDEESQVRNSVELVETSLAPAFRGNADFQALEAEFPGFLDQVIAEMKPLVARHTRKAVPDYQDRVAAIYATHLTAAEIEDLSGFFRSATGRKLINGMAENASVGAVLAEALEDPEGKTSYSAVVADHRATAEATKKLMDESDRPMLSALARKPYLSRLTLIGLELRKLDQAVMNEPDPEFDAEMEDLIERVLARFESTEPAN